MPESQTRRSQGKSGVGIVDMLAGKPIPGGVSSTAFQRVINVLREVIGKQEKKKKKSTAAKLFGE